MNLTHYPRLDEKLYTTRLENGLTVVVVPRTGFTKKLAYFVTDYGSIHTDFTFEGKQYKVPAGVAHYLEHKLFDMPDGRDVSEEFAARGAVTNAFTSYDLTAYYFSCTEQFPECLELLLEFVSTPYFTRESVEKEQGIIDQEIGMNEDAPDSVVFEELMQALYREYPVRVPILGTGESIREITPEILHLVHRAFYAPGNMLLCVIGDVDPQQVADTARKVLGEEQKPVGIKILPDELDAIGYQIVIGVIGNEPGPHIAVPALNHLQNGDGHDGGAADGNQHLGQIPEIGGTVHFCCVIQFIGNLGEVFL